MDITTQDQINYGTDKAALQAANLINALIHDVYKSQAIARLPADQQAAALAQQEADMQAAINSMANGNNQQNRALSEEWQKTWGIMNSTAALIAEERRLAAEAALNASIEAQRQAKDIADQKKDLADMQAINEEEKKDIADIQKDVEETKKDIDNLKEDSGSGCSLGIPIIGDIICWLENLFKGLIMWIIKIMLVVMVIWLVVANAPTLIGCCTRCTNRCIRHAGDARVPESELGRLHDDPEFDHRRRIQADY
jgi:hypothetical protein